MKSTCGNPGLSEMNRNETRQECEVTFLVMEYEALRSEILDNFGTARTMVGLFLLSLGAIGGFAVSGRATPKILVILPLLSAVFWWVHLDTRMIVTEIGCYISSRLAPRARALGSEESLAWEDTLRDTSNTDPCSPSSFRVFKFSTGLDGSAWPIYLLPSLLSLSVTADGATTPILLFIDQTNRSFYYPVWLWWVGALLQLLLVARAFITESKWWNAGRHGHQRASQRRQVQTPAEERGGITPNGDDTLAANTGVPAEGQAAAERPRG